MITLHFMGANEQVRVPGEESRPARPSRSLADSIRLTCPPLQALRTHHCALCPAAPRDRHHRGFPQRIGLGRARVLPAAASDLPNYDFPVSPSDEGKTRLEYNYKTGTLQLGEAAPTSGPSPTVPGSAGASCMTETGFFPHTYFGPYQRGL